MLSETPSGTLEHSPRVEELRQKLVLFMEEHIYPAEKVYAEQLDARGRWTVPPVMEELKAKARANGMLEPLQGSHGKRKAQLDAPTDAQLAQRAVELDSIKAKRGEVQCRAHTRGRCTNGGKCTAPHTTDPAEIMCNSTVAPGEKAGLSNKSYGWCHLVAKGLKCPYKECIHDGVDLKTDASMDETGE